MVRALNGVKMKKNQMIFIIIGVLILVGLAGSFSYWQKYLKPGAEVSKVPEEKTEILKEISQEEAIKIAQEKYPGEIKSIIKKEITLERNLSSPAFWLVEIVLKEPIFFEKINKTIKIIKAKVTMDKDIDIYELVE